MSLELKEIFSNSAGIDIGSEKIFIATNDGIVKSYLTFTSSFKEAINYLKEKKVKTVAMESTGVYGVVLYDMLEEAGFDTYLVNPAEIKHVPGRKTDVQDCQWLQKLHCYGLLKKSFIPSDDIRELRSYVRLREDHLEIASQHINHMQKALTLMNIRLHQVISQIHGASGLRIINAILQGERDPHILCSLCDERILKTKKNEVLASLEGNYKKEYLFMLRQALDCYNFYQDKIKECDKLIDELLTKINKGKSTPKSISKAKPIRHNKPDINDFHLKIVTALDGKDLTQLPGITDYNLMKIIAETGTNIEAWPSKKHFTSWLGLAPGSHSSGKIIKRSRKKSKTKAGQIFREAAQSLLQSKHIALGQFARRLKSRKGPQVAIKATARKLAELFYNMFAHGKEYIEKGVKSYEEKIIISQIKQLKKKALELNFELIPLGN